MQNPDSKPVTETRRGSLDVFMTAALPYSNGPLHIGHMLEYVQADAKARHLRLKGKNVVFVCADDNHGTAIELRAADLGIEPEVLVQNAREQHELDFKRYSISFDHYYQTHSDENRDLCSQLFKRLLAEGHIVEREIEQLFDTKLDRFLSDRHVKGICPQCRSADQYGDVCEECGTTYQATELELPISVLSGASPVIRKSTHYFFRLNKFEDFLKSWISQGSLQEPVQSLLNNWFKEGLREWNLSRDAPYFGFEIPDSPGKYFYVWLDAPMGYIATLENYWRNSDRSYLDVWKQDSTTEIHHFIGKDIAYFHTLFWPALLNGAGLKPPDRIFCHGFLTVNSRKMSKSRGTFLTADELANRVDTDITRFYLLSLLNGGIVDVNFDLDELVVKANSDLVGTIVNIAARCAALLDKHASGLLADSLPDPKFYSELLDEAVHIANDFEQHNTAMAIRRILAIAAKTNKYIANEKPWELVQSPSAIRAICTQGLIHFRAIAIMLQPITPKLSERSLDLFSENTGDYVAWDQLESLPFGRAMKAYTPLLSRINGSVVSHEGEAEQKANGENNVL